MQNFLDLKDALYMSSERRWWISIGLNFFAVLAAIGSVLLDPASTAGSGLGLLSMLCPLAAFIFREAAYTPTLRADKIRQLILFSDSLGQSIPPGEDAMVRTWAGGKLAPAPYIEPYYSSPLPHGANRLADNVAESAFFTVHLSEVVTRVFVVSTVGFGFVLFALLYVTATVPPAAQALPKITQAGLLMVGFLVFGDAAYLALRFSRLHAQSEKTYEIMCRLRSRSDANLADVTSTLQDYESIRAQTPPLPRALHLKYMKRLNAEFRAAHQR